MYKGLNQKEVERIFGYTQGKFIRKNTNKDSVDRAPNPTQKEFEKDMRTFFNISIPTRAGSKGYVEGIKKLERQQRLIMSKYGLNPDELQDEIERYRNKFSKD